MNVYVYKYLLFSLIFATVLPRLMSLINNKYMKFVIVCNNPIQFLDISFDNFVKTIILIVIL